MTSSTSSSTPKHKLSDFAEVRSSAIDGRGVFARVRIPKGTVWWRGTPENTVSFSKAQMHHLRESTALVKLAEERAERNDTMNKSTSSNQRSRSSAEPTLLDLMDKYLWYDIESDKVVLDLDIGRFVNHSDNPNSYGIPNCRCETLRDIEPGEEITEDYTTYDECPWDEGDEGYASADFSKKKEETSIDMDAGTEAGESGNGESLHGESHNGEVNSTEHQRSR